MDCKKINSYFQPHQLKKMKKNIGRYLFGSVFILAGISHFTMPEFFLIIMPPLLPYPLALVYISGLAEIVLGGALCFKKFESKAALGLIFLLIAVFPSNIYMALSEAVQNQLNTPAVVAWLRLPLQGVFIGFANYFRK